VCVDAAGQYLRVLADVVAGADGDA